MLYDEIAPDVVTPHLLDSSEPIKHRDTVIALYDFPGTQPSHLPLTIGDTVYVLLKLDSGWWDGVIIAQSEIQRGWFPHTYVRSVNYVQPVLINQLKLNKEIDSITAANTAANVLIPSFTSLLQKNLGNDAEHSSPANTTRKNSVVSFASSETSIPLDKGTNRKSSETNSVSTETMRRNAPMSSISSSISEGTSGVRTSHFPSTSLTSPETAEEMARDYKKNTGQTATWIAKFTTTGDYVYYSEQLGIYSEIMPKVDYEDTDFPFNIALPSKVAMDDIRPVQLAELTMLEDGKDTKHIEGDSSQIEDLFDPLKRDSNASSMATNSTGVLSYHHFSQPFFAMQDLFYKHPSDLSRWSEIRDQFVYLLDLCATALKDQNKQLFGTHFFRLNLLMSVFFSATRLGQDDFVESRYEKSIRRKLKRIARSFAQLYVNGILHLNIMHHAMGNEEKYMFQFDILRFSKKREQETEKRLSERDEIEKNDAEDKNNESERIANESSTNLKNTPIRPSISSESSHDNDLTDPTYFEQIECEIDNMKYNIRAVVKIFLKLTTGKVVRRSDYDSSDASGNEDDGEDRYDILPQVYPRFIVDEFNGGNWCNPFFSTKNPVLNVSGDDLKNRYHTKIIIDLQAFEQMNHYIDEMTVLSRETLEYLDPKAQQSYFNENLRGERNTQILRLIYKYMYHASSMMDLMESFDFTVFCLTNREYEKQAESEKANNEAEDTKNHDDANPLDAPSPSFPSSLTFDYPVVLEFFQYKQQFHDLIVNIVMSTQALTLEDPDVFKGLKEDEPMFYSKEHMKVPTEKASLLLTTILTEQLNELRGNHISLNPDTLLSTHIKEGVDFFKVILSIVQQLIDKRETILNYATRVMQDDFNVQLLVTERNNTILSEKTDEAYFGTGGHKKLKDVPWYLEGDDEYDLLLDLKGNIKGGTKEALIAHLTHHDLLDTAFNSAFLMTFALMMSLGELIGMLIARFNISAPEGLSFEEYNIWITKKQMPIRNRALTVMKTFLEKHWCNLYYNELVIKRWLAFAQLSPIEHMAAGKAVADLLVRLLNGEVICVERQPVMATSKPPAPLVKGPSLIKKMSLLDIDYIELARQLTLREFNLYCKITKFACLAKVWGKKSGLSESLENITLFIRASNQLTNFVAYMILRKLDIRKRVQIIRHFVQVAEKCRQFNNFSLMTAIISALYSSPIHRLKKTWKYLNADTLIQLQNMNKLMNSSRNFNEYRDVLKFIGSEPCVPFFGVYLSDLTFVYHGNPDFLMNRTRMLNFAKRLKTYEIVHGIDKFKTTAYNFQTVNEIQKYLDLWFDKCPTIEEQYQLSLNLESREALSTSSAVATAVAAASAGAVEKGQKTSLLTNFAFKS